MSSEETDNEQDESFRPSRGLVIPTSTRVLRDKAISPNSDPNDPLARNSLEDIPHLDPNELNESESIITIEDSEVFKSFECEDSFEIDDTYFMHSDEEDFNPFCIFPFPGNFAKPATMSTNSIPLSFINSLVKLGEVKDGGTISWSSRKQNLVSISSTESEYYALSETAREVQWIIQLLKDFGITFNSPVKVFCDSQSCIKMIENEKFSNRTKHIDVRCHHIKELLRLKMIELSYCPTNENVADMLTKPLAGTKISYLREKASLINACSSEFVNF